VKRTLAARALDLTSAPGIAERGPRTMRARALVAAWLDLGGRPRGLAEAVRWLAALAADAERNPDPCARHDAAASADGGTRG